MISTSTYAEKIEARINGWPKSEGMGTEHPYPWRKPKFAQEGFQAIIMHQSWKEGDFTWSQSQAKFTSWLREVGVGLSLERIPSKYLTLKIPRRAINGLEPRRLLKNKESRLACAERMLNLMNPFKSHSKML